jgi:hypothetical protein
MSMQAQEKNEYYQQSGVAMTCRSYEEYVRMFVLEEPQLASAIVLDVAGGASSFAAAAAVRGSRVTAVDPLYRMTVQEIAAYGREEIEVSTAKLATVADCYRWDYYGGLERHRANRELSLELFLADYASARERTGAEEALALRAGDKDLSQPPAPPSAEHGVSDRIPTSQPAVYIPGMLPNLPLPDNAFDLTLCSHFLFLYEEQFDYDFHVAAVRELLRVTKVGGEVRLYPLVTFRTQPYSRLDDLRRDIAACGAESALEPSRLPFLPGSDHLLVCRKTAEFPEV